MSNYYGPKIVTNGLVLCLDAASSKSYPGSGTTWFDLTERNNNATLINGVAYSSSNRGSFVFDGTNDYATVASSNGLYLANTSAVSVCCWGRTSDINTQYQALVMWEDQINANNVEPIRLAINGLTSQNNLLNCRFEVVNSSNTSNTLISLSTMSDNIYYYLVGTYDGTAIKLYINGVLNNQVSFSGNFKTPVSGTSARWIIGRGEVSNSDRLLNGNISQVSIYNRALSASEVLQNYNTSRGRFGL